MYTRGRTVSGIVLAVETAIREQVGTVAALAEATADVPYYKFNGLWTRQVQDLVRLFLFLSWGLWFFFVFFFWVFCVLVVSILLFRL